MEKYKFVSDPDVEVELTSEQAKKLLEKHIIVKA